ncbi:hypothetical protein V500_09422 [Pseudogymnoascus sp. VKM F-4518 (FW-2643)]|nr:hypothetical protein V500_09422 [Pseudogymnoascus sp. VKM F-4518 (FW-2643)]
MAAPNMSTEPQTVILDTEFDEFAKSILPLYSGASVTIYVGSRDIKYTLPKALLCKQSTYFSAMFQGSFKEGEDQTATLELVDGVVSVRAFEMLAQWLCIGRVVFKGSTSKNPTSEESTAKESTPEESIAAAIEFSRLADMCGIIGTEAQAAAHIKDTILASLTTSRNPDKNTCHITSAHIISAAHLPRGHAVRQILAKASVEGYLNLQHHKFSEEAQCVASFSADLLIAVRETMRSIRVNGSSGIEFEEPISGKLLLLRSHLLRYS